MGVIKYEVICTFEDGKTRPYSCVWWSTAEAAEEELFDALREPDVNSGTIKEHVCTCHTCEHWACMNVKDLIGACTIWHDSGITWPKAEESCNHWELGKGNDNGKEES